MWHWLRHFVEEGWVTLQHWSVQGDQQGSFKHFMRHYAYDVESLLFLDADEFVVLCSHPSIRTFYEAMGFASPVSGGRAICLAFRWLHFGTSDLPTHPPGTPVTAQYFKRSSDVERRMFGKVAVAGRGQIRQEPHKHFWHHCSAHGFRLRRRVTVLVDPDIARLHHFRFRYGVEGLKRRVERGTEGDFAGQSTYANKSVEYFDDLNKVVDRTLLGISALIPDLMTPRPTGFRKEHLSAGEFLCSKLPHLPPITE